MCWRICSIMTHMDDHTCTAEDREDVAAVRAAREEIAAGAKAVPWEQVKAELALD